MSKLKQKYYAYKTAEKKLNDRKVALKNEFLSEMRISAKTNDIERFNDLSKELIQTLGDEYEITVIQMKVLYEL